MKYIFGYLAGFLCVCIGIKTIFDRKTKVIIRLWSWGDVSQNNSRQPGGGYSESEQTGFIAVLVGIIEIALGFWMMHLGWTH
jgi:hypothetical protein